MQNTQLFELLGAFFLDPTKQPTVALVPTPGKGFPRGVRAPPLLAPIYSSYPVIRDGDVGRDAQLTGSGASDGSAVLLLSASIVPRDPGSSVLYPPGAFVCTPHPGDEDGTRRDEDGTRHGEGKGGDRMGPSPPSSATALLIKDQAPLGLGPVGVSIACPCRTNPPCNGRQGSLVQAIEARTNDSHCQSAGWCSYHRLADLKVTSTMVHGDACKTAAYGVLSCDHCHAFLVGMGIAPRPACLISVALATRCGGQISLRAGGRTGHPHASRSDLSAARALVDGWPCP